MATFQRSINVHNTKWRVQVNTDNINSTEVQGHYFCVNECSQRLPAIWGLGAVIRESDSKQLRWKVDERASKASSQPYAPLASPRRNHAANSLWMGYSQRFLIPNLLHKSQLVICKLYCLDSKNIRTCHISLRTASLKISADLATNYNIGNIKRREAHT